MSGAVGQIEVALPWGRAVERTTLGVRAILLLVVFYATLMAVGLGRERALTRHEVFAAQPAREMLDSTSGVPAARRWMVQQFGGEPRYQKPPAMSWMIAGSFAVFGEREWAARLPAVVAGGVMVVLVGMWGARQFGYTAGVVSGLMQGTFYFVLMQARLAEVDMPLGAVVTAGMLCLGWAWVPPPSSSVGSMGNEEGKHRAVLGWVFAVLAGVAMAMKGPVGPGVMYVGAVGFAGLMWWRGGGWGVMWWVLHPGRLMVFAVVAGAWPVGAYWADPGVAGFWEKELRGRVETGIQGAEPWWFYVWNVPMLLLPWVLVAPAAVGEVRGKGKGDLVRFTGAWLVGGVVLLSVVADKHKHYAIPVLAGVTPFLAVGLLAVVRKQMAGPVRGYRRAMGAWGAGFAGAVVGVLRFGGEHAGVVAVVVGLLGVGGLVVLGLEWKRWGRAEVVGMFVTAWVVMAGVNGLVTPAFETFWRFRAVAMAAREHIERGERVTLVKLGMHPVAFYLPLPVGRMDVVRADGVPAGGSLLMMAQEDVEDLAEMWGVYLEGVVAGGTTTEGGGKRREDAIILVRVVKVGGLSGGGGEGSMDGR